MTATPFVSIGPPSASVEQARQAAQPMRRSIAEQIEYWASLGQLVEHIGLSVLQARTAIEQYEAASASSHAPATAPATAPASVDALTARLLTAQACGWLAERVREVVRENQASAV